MSMCPYPVVLEATGGLSVTFNDDWDAYGFWMLTEFPKGWFGGSVQQTLLQPAGTPGAIIAENRKGAKAVVLNGFAGSVDGDGWWSAANRLEAVTDLLIDSDGALTVHEPTGAKQLVVRLPDGGLGLARVGVLAPAGAPREVGAGFMFQVPLLAVDPAKVPV